MREQSGDLWAAAQGSVLCITTNGVVNRNGLAVMGRGIALQAKEKFPDIAEVLAQMLKMYGNHVAFLGSFSKWQILSFPVKHKWNERADVELIKRSIKELLLFARYGKWETVYLPRPGCGNGSLQWAAVKPIIEPLLDDRFVVVERSINA